MIDFLYSVDVGIFYFINHTLANPIFNKFFPFITDVKNWYLTYVVLWLICFFKGGRTGKVAAIGSIFVIIASDQISSNLIKNFVGRIRPCNVLSNVNILVGCTGSFSFPSSHAVNNFAIAMFFYKFFPKLKYVLFVSAFFVALSRPYVGVHYPSDIFFGALIGTLIGYIMAIIAFKTDLFIKQKFNK
ncbi:MAG: phosphatase PAP2 family protein [bacterium]